jgi:MFS family permease
LTKKKLENNYCYTKLNQFDICVPDQICSNINGRINLLLYNDTFYISNKSMTRHQEFIEEMKLINAYYKTFFVSHNYQISKDKLLLPIDMVKYKGDKINFAIVLTKRGKWNLFLKFTSLCQRNNAYFYIVLVIIIGGAIGSLLFGLLADIYGRKRIIIICLFIVAFSFSIFTIYSFLIEWKYGYYLKEYEDIYKSINQTDYDILSKLYTQSKTSEYFESTFPVFLISLLILSFALRPLGKICMALLLENSLNELQALENFRNYTFSTTGLPPIFAFIICVLVNNFTTTMIIISSVFGLLFIFSFFLVNESMRYHYEYSEWRELTDEIMHLFKVTDDNSLNYKNKIEFEAFKVEENRRMLGNLTKKINSVFDLAKQRIIYLNRDIRRNSSFIIKKMEVIFNPLLVYTSISANRVFIRLRALMVIILIIIYAQVFFVEKELVEIPFFITSDLYIDIYNNYIINSNYFILAIVTFASNFFFYLCYRISCFKLIFYFSLITVTFLLVLYHFITYESSDFPLDINQTNFKMLEYHHKKNRVDNINILIFFIHFFLNGINFYINLLVIKLTKTLYRCSLFGINTCLALLAFAFGETLNYQIEHYFLLIGALNVIGIIAEFYFGELKGIPNLINDLKQNINRETNKNKEKNKKL